MLKLLAEPILNNAWAIYKLIGLKIEQRPALRFPY